MHFSAVVDTMSSVEHDVDLSIAFVGQQKTMKMMDRRISAFAGVYWIRIERLVDAIPFLSGVC